MIKVKDKKILNYLNGVLSSSDMNQDELSEDSKLLNKCLFEIKETEYIFIEQAERLVDFLMYSIGMLNYININIEYSDENVSNSLEGHLYTLNFLQQHFKIEQGEESIKVIEKKETEAKSVFAYKHKPVLVSAIKS